MAKVKQISSVTPIHSKVNVKTSSDSKWDHACDIAWLMSPAGTSTAITLQLENLVATYSYKEVRAVLDGLAVKIKKGA